MLVVLYVYHAFITYTFIQIGLDGEYDRLSVKLTCMFPVPIQSLTIATISCQ